MRREERVLLVLDDGISFLAAFLGAMRLGAVPIPVNFLLRAEDFGYFLDDSYARMAVAGAPFLEKLGPQLETRSGVRLVVADGTGPSEAESFDEWLSSGSGEFDPVDTHRDDVAFWLYSSGSTGHPKGVVHLHHDMSYTADNYGVGVLGVGEDDVCFSTTKLFHAYGLGNGLTFPFSVGATAVYMGGRPAPDRALDRIEMQRPTVLFSVPTLYNAMGNQPDMATRDLTSVRLAVSAAEPLPPEVWKKFRDATGLEILDGVGSTEMLHIYCSNRPGAVRPGSSGTEVPGYQLEVRDLEDRAVTAGVAGELWVRGDSALASYWHQHEKTKRSLVGDWFRSGDRYRKDENGYYWYEGRMDDMMKVSGLWVSPIEIENRLIEHQAVSEAAVVGVEREGFVRIMAAVILKQAGTGSTDLADELQEWCKAGLQRYQFPHIVEFVDDLPRTATGKIQRFKLRS